MAFDSAMKMMGGKPKAPAVKKPEVEKPVEHGKVGGEDGDEAIHAHLKARHAETGNAHSHVEHHFDGSHTSHHVDEHGEVHGPHDHENLEALKSHMNQFLGEEEQEGHPEHDGGEDESLGGYGGSAA